MSALADEREDALRRAAGRFVRRRAPAGTPAGGVPWDAGFFGLDRVRRFREARGERQAAALVDCGDALIAESWFIERLGIRFCARMTSLSTTLEEQRIYALIGADEAAHTAWLEPWVGDPLRAADPFNRFIGGLAETGTPQPLAFLLQVVLEGYGIVHYRDLAAGCRDAALEATLGRMARDEALHHAAGLAVFHAERLSAPERRFLADGACAFLQMIRSGPQAVVAALDRAIGAGNRADVACLFEALGANGASAAKLDRLRRLMSRPGMEWLIGELEAKGVFTPCTAAECAQIYAGTP